MSELDTLLPTSASQVPSSDSSKPASLSERIGKVLESPHLHNTILTLIAIDACCVLADLIYSFLSPDCGSPDEELPPWLQLLSHISLVITTLFLVEIPLALWAFGVRHINPFGPVPHAGLHLFDALVILTTFTGEIVLRGKEREIAGLLIFLRLWRLVKLVGGVAIGAGELQEELAADLAKLRKEIARTQVELAELRKENSLLKQELVKIRPRS